MMYETPIKVIMSDFQTQFEDGIYKAVRNAGIDVDKEELIRALEYDRQQYEKGYNDGRTAGALAMERNCEDCVYIDWDFEKYPCIRCKHNHPDRFVPK